MTQGSRDGGVGREARQRRSSRNARARARDHPPSNARRRPSCGQPANGGHHPSAGRAEEGVEDRRPTVSRHSRPRRHGPSRSARATPGRATPARPRSTSPGAHRRPARARLGTQPEARRADGRPARVRAKRTGGSVVCRPLVGRAPAAPGGFLPSASLPPSLPLSPLSTPPARARQHSEARPSSPSLPCTCAQVRAMGLGRENWAVVRPLPTGARPPSALASSTSCLAPGDDPSASTPTR